MRECAFKGWLPLAMAPQQCVRTCAQLILSWVRAMLFPFYCFSLDLLQVPKVVSHLHTHNSSVLLPRHQSSNPWNHSLHQPLSPPPPTLSLIFYFKPRQGNPNAAYYLTILCISGLFFSLYECSRHMVDQKVNHKINDPNAQSMIFFTEIESHSAHKTHAASWNCWIREFETN